MNNVYKNLYFIRMGGIEQQMKNAPPTLKRVSGAFYCLD